MIEYITYILEGNGYQPSDFGVLQVPKFQTKPDRGKYIWAVELDFSEFGTKIHMSYCHT